MAHVRKMTYEEKPRDWHNTGVVLDIGKGKSVVLPFGTSEEFTVTETEHTYRVLGYHRGLNYLGFVEIDKDDLEVILDVHLEDYELRDLLGSADYDDFTEEEVIERIVNSYM